MLTLTGLLNRLPGGVALGIIWGIMALGVYITFRILKTSDLTVDGSFTTGGAVTIMLILLGVSPIISVIVAAFVGVLCGIVTGLIHTKLKIPAILSGILVQIALYSINMHILGGKSNQAVNPENYSLLVAIGNVPKSIIVGLIIVLILIATLYWYFGTEQGCAIRATGNSSRMSLAQGINIDTMNVIGFALGNGIVAFAGGLLAEYQGYADINMGRGAIVIGLAAIIIGEALLDVIFNKGCSFYTRFAFVIVGGIIYYLVMVLILWLRIDSSDLKLFTALIVIIFLAIPNLKKKGIK